MGLRELLARRAEERRIKRKSKKLFEEAQDATESRLRRDLRRMGEKGARVGRRLYAETQLRKGEGKEVLKRQAMKLLGATKTGTRELLTGTTKPAKKRRQKKW